ncbi:MAG: hypothetical protein ACRC6V_01825 [Bacteroidales bacterium]
MKLLKNKKKVIKSYSFISMTANFLIALSVSGLSVLGVLSSELALPLLISCALFLGLLGLLGRFIDQTVEDVGEDNVD